MAEDVKVQFDESKMPKSVSADMKADDKVKKRVLWMTDDPYAPTGYGIVTRNVLKYLASTDYEVMAVGLQHGNAPVIINTSNKPELKSPDNMNADDWESLKKFYDESYKLLPRANCGEGSDVVEMYIKTFNPDIFCTLRDIGLQAGYIPAVQKCRKEGWKGKWVGYVPIDSGRCAIDWNIIFKEMDVVVAMSQWGKEIIKLFFPEVDPVVIPHGVDTKTFHPMTNEQKKLLRGQKPWGDCFIVGAVGRNQYRKMWHKLVEGFAEFAKDKNDVALLLHTDQRPIVSHDGYVFDYILRDHNVYEKTAFTMNEISPITRFWVTDDKMNEIYNCMDVFCLMTGGEGFGLPLIEAQAAGLPVVTTEHTSGIELVKDHGILVPVLKDKYGRNCVFQGQNGVQFVYPDDKLVAEALQKLYDDKKLREEYSVKSREFSKGYDWEVIVKHWKKLFDNLTGVI